MDLVGRDSPYGLSCYTLFYCARATLSVRRNGRNGGMQGASPERHDSLRCADMLYEITVEASYLKVDLYNWETAQETRDALGAIAAEARKHTSSQILISVHASKPIFRVEQYGLPDYFREFGEV